MTVHGHEPVLKRREAQPGHEAIPWVTVQQKLRESDRYRETEKQIEARKRKMLLERWGHVPIIGNCLKLIECHKKTIELMEELMMGLLHRLDWNKPITADKDDAAAIAEVMTGDPK